MASKDNPYSAWNQLKDMGTIFLVLALFLVPIASIFIALSIQKDNQNLRKLQSQVMALSMPQAVREVVYGRLSKAANGNAYGCWSNHYSIIEGGGAPGTFVLHLVEIAVDCSITYQRFPEGAVGDGMIVRTFSKETGIGT